MENSLLATLHEPVNRRDSVERRSAPAGKNQFPDPEPLSPDERALLEGFAARLLGDRRATVVSVQGLHEQGYDTGLLKLLVNDYNRLPRADRRFLVRATQSVVIVARHPQP